MITRERLIESILAFLALGIFIGCTASALSPIARSVLGVAAAVWVLIAYWRLAGLNDRERRDADKK